MTTNRKLYLEDDLATRLAGQVKLAAGGCSISSMAADPRPTSHIRNQERDVRVRPDTRWTRPLKTTVTPGNPSVASEVRCWERKVGVPRLCGLGIEIMWSANGHAMT